MKSFYNSYASAERIAARENQNQSARETEIYFGRKIPLEKNALEAEKKKHERKATINWKTYEKITRYE